MIQNRVQIHVESMEEVVYTDDKWFIFILNQILLNSVKYRSETPMITIYTSNEKGDISLHIKDNGLGISEGDLPRIFEKGFTGINGRTHNKATRIGVYLCKKLSSRLGIYLSAHSKVKDYNEMVILFPKGTHVKT